MQNINIFLSQTGFKPGSSAIKYVNIVDDLNQSANTVASVAKIYWSFGNTIFPAYSNFQLFFEWLLNFKVLYLKEIFFVSLRIIFGPKFWALQGIVQMFHLILNQFICC